MAWGTATGSASCSGLGAFDAQPTWNAASGAPVGDQAAPHADTVTAYPDRHWYIDLGATARSYAGHPAGRYLVIGTAASPAARANELAFVGYRVP